MTTQETVRDIKAGLRLVMNGVAAQSMRERGIRYKLNFGATVPELKRLAAKYTPDHELAMALWKEDIRECRMLAAMLEPADSFDWQLADLWVSMTEYPDLAEVCCKYLYQKIEGASVLAFSWIAAEEPMKRYCGFLTLAHLMRQGQDMAQSYRDELHDQAWAAAADKDLLVRDAALTAIRVFNEVYGKDGQRTAD